MSRVEFRRKARAIARMLIGCSKWYSNKPNLAFQRAEMVVCKENSNHANSGNGFCLCTHVMFDE